MPEITGGQRQEMPLRLTKFRPKSALNVHSARLGCRKHPFAQLRQACLQSQYPCLEYHSERISLNVVGKSASLKIIRSR